MENFNQLFRKPVLYILLCIGVFAVIWNVKIKWIAMPLGVATALIIIYQLNIINLLVTVKYKLAKEKEREENLLADEYRESWSARKQKTVYYLMLSLFLILGIAISISGKEVEQYLFWKPFVLQLFVIGGIAGILTYRLFNHYLKPVFDDDEKENYVKAYSFMIPILFIFHLMVWYNKLSPSQIIKREQVTLADKGKNYLHDNNYIFLNIDNKRTRFEVPKKDFTNIKETDTIIIVVRKGALGHSFVDSLIIKRRDKS